MNFQVVKQMIQEVEREWIKECGIGGKKGEWSEVWIQGEGNEMKREASQHQGKHTRQGMP